MWLYCFWCSLFLWVDGPFILVSFSFCLEEFAVMFLTAVFCWCWNLPAFAFLKKSLFHFCFERVCDEYRILHWWVFLPVLKCFCLVILSFACFGQETWCSYSSFSLFCLMFLFSLVALSFLSLDGFVAGNLGVNFFLFLVFRVQWTSWICAFSSHQFWENVGHYFFVPFSFSSN